MLFEKIKNDKFLNVGYYKLLIVTMDNKAVKIDEDLLKRIEKLIMRKDKRIKYAHKKQFVNVAVLNLLDIEEKNKGDNNNE